MMRVGYDGQALLAPGGGTGKGLQLRNLLGPFAKRFVGFASKGPNASGIPLIQEGASRYNVWQQFSLPASLRRHGVQFFLAPYNTAPYYLPKNVELGLVLHDTILMKGFRKHNFRGRLLDSYRRLQIPPSVARARVVLTVSEHARGEILDAFPGANVRVIPCTIPQEWFEPAPSTGRENYLLMVTSSAPHKNARGAIEGYARYARRAGSQAVPFKVVGLSREAAVYQEISAQLGVAPLISFLPVVSDAELRQLYRAAVAVMVPSFAEGFGIPMLEAMASGTPVIAARATSLPEVGGEAGFYFDPSSLEDMEAALWTVMSDSRLRAQMSGRGLARSETYRPDVVGAQVLAFWKEFAGVEGCVLPVGGCEVREALRS